MKYIVCSDESYISAERHRSIAAISFPQNNNEFINKCLFDILQESGVSEFKWRKVRSAKYMFCAEKFINFILDNVDQKQIRIDTIIWDTYDRRHSVMGRDDKANFARMFFHLLKNLISKREREANWEIYPDEKHEIDWETINNCLINVGKRRTFLENPLFGDSFSEEFFKIDKFEQICSNEVPCCQVADLFAGLAVFSKKYYQEYKTWSMINGPQMTFFEQINETTFSSAKNERFKTLDLLIKKCKSMKLRVSIDTNQSLSTFNPNCPINFWSYVPQHNLDKAPIKNS